MVGRPSHEGGPRPQKQINNYPTSQKNTKQLNAKKMFFAKKGSTPLQKKASTLTKQWLDGHTARKRPRSQTNQRSGLTSEKTTTTRLQTTTTSQTKTHKNKQVFKKGAGREGQEGINENGRSRYAAGNCDVD